MEKRIFLSSPTMHEEEMKFVQEAFDRNWVAPLGFNCDGFEAEMVEYIKSANEDCYAVALASGTAAIHLAVILAGVQRGDTVFCSDLTFAATVNPITYVGAKQIFIDAEYETWNMDPEALEKAFRKYPDTKVVILAHLYGTPAKMDEILDICNRHNAILIEDAAEALSATYKGKKCGTFGKYNILSFNGNKIITTSGGGMLLTKDKSLRDKALKLATQSRECALWYQHEEIGYNYRMSNIVAGIGRGQLLHVEEHRDLKEKIYNRYKDGFEGCPVTMNPYLSCSRPNFWLSCILLSENCKNDPISICVKLCKENIEARPIWKPMHMQPVFADCDYISAKEKNVCEDIFSRGLCLPSDIKMTEEEQNEVICHIKTML